MRKIFPLLAAAFFLMGQALHEVPQEIRVTAVGDYGSNENTKSVLDRINMLAPDLHFALGDLSYATIPEKEWCRMVKDRVKQPFLLLAGNHDTNGKDGDIDTFAACLPYTYDAKLTGDYAKEYYIDVPKEKPLARFIMIAPNIQYKGVSYEYAGTNKHAKWLVDAIVSARGQHIPWIVVGMHKVCISTETKSCEIGQELVDLLIGAKVDLVLAGHVHAYERTRQLSCMKQNAFDADCVVSTPGYGQGTTFATVGNGGVQLRKTNPKDPEAPYFAKVVSENEGNQYGVLQLSISENDLKAELIEAKQGAVLDSFSIQKPVSALEDLRNPAR